MWPVLEQVWGRARALRRHQPLLALDRAVADRPADVGLRAVRRDELDSYLPAAAAMFAEELGVSPTEGGAGHYRARIAGLLREGRAFGVIDHGQVLFKADFGAVSPRTCQIQGVWTRPDLRGRGLGTAAMIGVLDRALALAPSASLYVNDFNTPARRLYARLGMREVACSRRCCSSTAEPERKAGARRRSSRLGSAGDHRSRHLRLGRHADAMAHRRRRGLARGRRRQRTGRSAARAERAIWRRPRTTTAAPRWPTCSPRPGSRRRRLAAASRLVGAAHLPRPRRAAGVRRAAERGIRIGVLSNTLWPRSEHERIFARDEVWPLIDGAVYSSEIAWTKPHPEAFRAALAAVGVDDPARAVFVGDRPFDDIHGAKAVGMRAVLVPHSDIPADSGAGRRRARRGDHRLGRPAAVVDAWRRANRCRGTGTVVSGPR